MHTQHALSLARQRQDDLRRRARTPRLAASRHGAGFGAALRLASRKRQRLGWLLVDVGLQLAVDRAEPDEHREASSVAA